MNAHFPKSKMTLIDLFNKFSDENYCREYLFEMRFKKGFVCPFCGCSECGKIATRHMLRCKYCRKQISPTNGTFMHGTHIKLKYWIIAAYLFMTDKGGLSAINLMKKLHMTYKTAWYLLYRFRKAMKTREERYFLEGVVQFDDTYVGSPTHGGKRGRGTDKIKVMVALSLTDKKQPKYLKMASVPNLKGITVGKFAVKNIKEGSTIESDNASSYKKPLADKYFHKFKTYNADDGDLMWLHKMISNLKRGINGTYFHIGAKYVDLYLAEFCYRFNRRKIGETNYENLLAAMVQ